MKFPDLSSGLCSSIGVEFYYPEEDSSGTSTEEKMAKALCHQCPVRQACGEWGVRHEVYGIWGGMSPLDRRKVRHRNKITVEQIIGSDYL
jgi:WhiB family redox-sensing transcriptional regulator